MDVLGTWGIRVGWLLATRAWLSWLVALGTFLPWGGQGNVLQIFAAGIPTTLRRHHVARGRLSGSFTSKFFWTVYQENVDEFESLLYRGT